ncbi:splicing factor 3B subunit 2 [Trichonephila clavipes]|nr:splicing factor 3B subunit 2 [Trichonephila clavipes]
MAVAELQQKVNLKASSNMVLIPQHWSFRGEYSQDKSGIGKLAWKLTDFIKQDGGAAIEGRRKMERRRKEVNNMEKSEQDGGAREHGENERDSDYVGEDRNKMGC